LSQGRRLRHNAAPIWLPKSRSKKKLNRMNRL
jgi:hypothetical protein